MKAISDQGNPFNTVVLTGKENYNVWAFTVREHLKTASLIKYIDYEIINFDGPKEVNAAKDQDGVKTGIKHIEEK